MKALLWDMNGVIVHDEPLQEQTWRQIFERAGIELPHGWFKQHFLGRKFVASLASMLPHLTPDEHWELIAAKQAVYDQLTARGLPPVPGAVDLMRHVHDAGLRQAIVTSCSRSGLRRTLDEFNLCDLLHATVSGEDVEKGKPDPECFLRGAHLLGVKPADCWVLEDSLYGIEAAKAAGMRVVGVATSYDQHELAHADLVAEDPLHPALLDRMRALMHTRRG